MPPFFGSLYKSTDLPDMPAGGPPHMLRVSIERVSDWRVSMGRVRSVVSVGREAGVVARTCHG